MAETTTPNGAATFVVPADLSPGDADAVKQTAIKTLAAAKESGTAVEMDLTKGRPTPCSVQIVVSTTKSADSSGVPIELTASAKDALADLGMN